MLLHIINLHTKSFLCNCVHFFQKIWNFIFSCSFCFSFWIKLAAFCVWRRTQWGGNCSWLSNLQSTQILTIICNHFILCPDFHTAIKFFCASTRWCSENERCCMSYIYVVFLYTNFLGFTQSFKNIKGWKYSHSWSLSGHSLPDGVLLEYSLQKRSLRLFHLFLQFSSTKYKLNKIKLS